MELPSSNSRQTIANKIAYKQSFYLPLRSFTAKAVNYYKKLLLNLSSCDLCGSPCTEYKLLCQACFDDLPIFYPEKTQGDLLNWPAINHILPRIHFDHLICLSPYSSPFDQWLRQFKYQGRFELAPLFSRLLSSYWQQINNQYPSQAPNLVLSVPLHIEKWQQRGYNQAHLIARSFAKDLGFYYDETLLRRKKVVASQVGQSGQARRKNLRQAFELTKPQQALPEHIMLIDDVVTTGATASEISRCLKQAGVKKVTVVALCLALPTS